MHAVRHLGASTELVRGLDGLNGIANRVLHLGALVARVRGIPLDEGHKAIRLHPRPLIVVTVEHF